MCVISSQKGPKTICFRDPNCVRVAMKKKKVSLFRDGKTLDAERFPSLSSNKETRTEEGDREILCGKGDRAVLNRKKKDFPPPFFFERGRIRV